MYTQPSTRKPKHSRIEQLIRDNARALRILERELSLLRSQLSPSNTPEYVKAENAAIMLGWSHLHKSTVSKRLKALREGGLLPNMQGVHPHYLYHTPDLREAKRKLSDLTFTFTNLHSQ